MAENQWRWVGLDGFEYTGDLETLRAALREGRLPPTAMVSAAHLDGWLPAAEVPELSTGGFEPAPVQSQPLPAFHIEDEAPTMRDNPIPEPPPEEPLPPPTLRLPASPAKRSNVVLVVVLALLGLGVLGVVAALLVFMRSEPASAPEPRASASASASASPATAGAKACVPARARLVAKPVFGKIPLEVAAAGKGRVAVAFARSRSEAQVVVLAADTLEKQHEKRQRSKASVAGARPLLRGDGVELVLDAEEPTLRGTRSILGDKPLRIGSAPAGIARSAGDGEPEVVWPLNEKDLTPMRVESSEGVGHFVALRSGGQSGKVLAGWLAYDGSKKTDFIAPELTAHAVGTPAPALGPSATLLLVAAKPSESSAWRLFAGKASLGQVPARLAPLTLGDDTAVRISPAAAALPNSGWLLQWTEGPDDAHVVKVQILDSELAAVATPVTVSPQGSDAGQGRVWLDGERAVSFFLVSTGDSHELWAAPLSCK